MTKRKRAVISSLPPETRQRMQSAPVPVQYEDAIRALAACQTLDESKHWADKAEALAAWARIYRDDKASLEARRLKLHAYERMGRLAQELHPKHGPRQPGAYSALQQAGLNKHQASRALNIARASKKDLEMAVEHGYGIERAAVLGRGLTSVASSTEAWAWLSGKVSAAGTGAGLSQLRATLRKRNPREVAFAIAKAEAEFARPLVLEIVEWLDEFEQALAKDGGPMRRWIARHCSGEEYGFHGPFSRREQAAEVVFEKRQRGESWHIIDVTNDSRYDGMPLERP